MRRYFLNKKKRSTFLFPSIDIIPRNRTGSVLLWSNRILLVILILLLAFMFLGFTLPSKKGIRYGYGADIMIVLDLSDSMQEYFPKDSSETKIAVVRDAVKRYIEKKQKKGRDRYGLVVFGNSAVKILSFTFSHEVFLKCFTAQESSLGSTYFFQGMIVALNEMSVSKARNKIIIFISDGGGEMGERKSAFIKFIKKQGIKFYWIAVDCEHNFLDSFMSELGLLGKRIEVDDPIALENAFSEIYSSERSIIAYATKVPVIGFDIIYLILALMTIVWVLNIFLRLERSL